MAMSLEPRSLGTTENDGLDSKSGADSGRPSAKSACRRAEQFRLEHARKICPPLLTTPSASLGQLDVRLERVDHSQDVESAAREQARAQGSQLMQSIDHGAIKDVAPRLAGRGLAGVVR